MNKEPENRNHLTTEVTEDTEKPLFKSFLRAVRVSVAIGFTFAGFIRTSEALAHE